MSKKVYVLTDIFSPDVFYATAPTHAPAHLYLLLQPYIVEGLEPDAAIFGDYVKDLANAGDFSYTFLNGASPLLEKENWRKAVPVPFFPSVKIEFKGSPVNSMNGTELGYHFNSYADVAQWMIDSESSVALRIDDYFQPDGSEFLDLGVTNAVIDEWRFTLLARWWKEMTGVFSTYIRINKDTGAYVSDYFTDHMSKITPWLEKIKDQIKEANPIIITAAEKKQCLQMYAAIVRIIRSTRKDDYNKISLSPVKVEDNVLNELLRVGASATQLEQKLELWQ